MGKLYTHNEYLCNCDVAQRFRDILYVFAGFVNSCHSVFLFTFGLTVFNSLSFTKHCCGQKNMVK